MTYIGQKIKELRRKNDLTQEKLADFLGVTYQAVSKWENGITMPDLSLIVPLAKLLHTSTDDLLGMTSPENDSAKAEYDSLCAKVHDPAQLETAKKAAAEYPGELKYLLWQADCMFLLAYERYTDQTSFYADLEKALRLFLTVLDNTDDTDLKRKASASVVHTLSVLRRYDEAKQYAEAYPDTPVPTKDIVMGWALTGDEKTEHMQKRLMRCLDDMLWILIETKDHADPNLKMLSYLGCAETCIRTMFPDGNYLRYYDELMLISVYKAQIYQHTDADRAISCLRDAGRYAQEYDRLFMEKPACRTFTSPYFDRLHVDSADLCFNEPPEENRLTDRFSWWLSGACFDVLRGHSDFAALSE